MEYRFYNLSLIEVKQNFMDLCNLIYDGLCILESFCENEMKINKNFDEIMHSLAYVYDSFLNLYGNEVQLRNSVDSFKEKLCDKMLTLLKDNLFKTNLQHKHDRILDTFKVKQNF